MTSPGPFDQQSNSQQPYPSQQHPNQQNPGQQQPYAPQQPSYPTPQPQFASPQPPSQPGYPQQQGQPTSWRILTMDLKQPPWYGYTWLKPTVTIDGFAYGAEWKRCTYQVPADRPVHVQCHVNYLWEYGKAALTLQPNQQPHLEYTAPAQAYFSGDIGAPGTTQANGKGVAIGILAVAAVVLFGAISLLTTTIAFAGVASSY